MTMLTFTKDKWDFVQSIAWIIFVSEVLFVRFPSCYCHFLFSPSFRPQSNPIIQERGRFKHKCHVEFARRQRIPQDSLYRIGGNI